MKKLRERQVSLRTALTMCAAAGAITAVICLISTGWNTNEVGKKLREIDRLVSDKYVGELDADNVADYAAAGYITGLGDKWSSYIPAENYEAYRMSGEGKGCGIGVSVTSTRRVFALRSCTMIRLRRRLASKRAITFSVREI